MFDHHGFAPDSTFNLAKVALTPKSHIGLVHNLVLRPFDNFVIFIDRCQDF